MLVFWLQKLVCIDREGQSRVYNISNVSTTGGRGREEWEKHKVTTSIT